MKYFRNILANIIVAIIMVVEGDYSKKKKENTV